MFLANSISPAQGADCGDLRQAMTTVADLVLVVRRVDGYAAGITLALGGGARVLD